MALVAIIVVTGIVGATLAIPLLNGNLSLLPSPAAAATAAPPTPATPGTPLATPSPELTPSPSALETPTPALTPAPTTAVPPPTPAPTPAATAVPAAQQTYVVQQGDTLAAIAQQFDTSVGALQAVNGIEDPNEIIVGAVLLIP